MIDLDEYDSLFQKMDDLFQGMTSVFPDTIGIVDDYDENYEESRRNLHSSTIAIADGRDDIDTDLEFLKEKEDKIAAELRELTDLIGAKSKDDRPTRRQTPEKSEYYDKDRSVEVKDKLVGSTKLDKAIMKQLEAFRVSGRATIRDNRKNHILREEKKKHVDTLWQKSSKTQENQPELHIFQSKSQLDFWDASPRETRNAVVQNHCTPYGTQEESVEVFHDDIGVEIDSSGKVRIARELKETYPLEFPGRSPTAPKSALSLLFRDSSDTSSSSDESSLVWLEAG